MEIKLEKKILVKSSFKKLFPKTFSYLKLIIPLMYPDVFRLSSKLPDVVVKLTYQEGRVPSAYCVYNNFLFFNRYLVFNLAKLFSNRGDFQKKLSDFSNDSFLRKSIKYLDAMPKFRAVLIHEYVHFLDHKYSLQKHYHLAPSINELSSRDCIPLAKQLTFEKEISSHVDKEVLDYTFNDMEIQARLAEWIFLTLKGNTTSSIKSLEKYIFKKYYFQDVSKRYNLTKEIYESKKHDLHLLVKKHVLKNNSSSQEKEIYEKNITQLKKDIKNLHKRLRHLHHDKIYVQQMEKEVLRIVNQFKEKYDHANV
jgi:hypothetical protein